jgi:hypothetical protein
LYVNFGPALILKFVKRAFVCALAGL